MKTLLIFRHAKSSWKAPNSTDHDRPLNKRGKHDAPRMGRLLREQDLVPNLIVSSTANRARTTAATVAENCGYERAVELNSDLYHADPQTCIQVLRELYADVPCVMLVGHNPGLEEILEALTGVDEPLPTAALAQVTLPISSWSEIHIETEGTLANLWRPRELA